MTEEGTVHIAIVDFSTMKNIASGVKTIESRFSINRIKPFGVVHPNDLVLLKKSGGGIYGYFIVEKVTLLTNFVITEIKETYNNQIVADDVFWTKKNNARYASLIYCRNPVMAKSYITYKRKGMDGWIVVAPKCGRQVVCFAGAICSGKTEYARGLSNILQAKYIHFGTALKKYAAENGYAQDRASLQKIGQYIMESVGSAGLMNLVKRELEGIPASCNIVFDGIRHIEIYNEIKAIFGDSTLVYVNSSTKERYGRYLRREKRNISFDEFTAIDSMPVEREISEIEKEANLVLKSVDEKNINQSVEIVTHIISAMITGRNFAQE